ncbi:putative two-component system response regulator [Patulibacter medicamentivorans]|uniref:Putative two-component system response regulator n=1 Tax=Patulibacter medicamentivorans TaxID=1097667 RepID=H0E7B8_9ACTN|nr:response regulator transcription factor [Patulibacter medicamentivorans]EHN10443.1 putative two-component system response regulator [Patulibacter medicamentivorans]
MRVLIAEDEEFLAEAIQTGLRRAAIAADVALDGAAALRALAVVDYDAIVLDRDLPQVHGDEVARTVAERHPGVRVLMLTAAARVDQRVEGLRLGADDYLAKPFAFEELVARLHALARRPAATAPPVLEVGDLRIDSFRREAFRDGRLLRLTRKQFAVLELLARAAGGVVSAEELLQKVWDENVDPFTTAPRVTVSTLRKALGPPDPIETVTGVGYRLAVADDGDG